MPCACKVCQYTLSLPPACSAVCSDGSVPLATKPPIPELQPPKYDGALPFYHFFVLLLTAGPSA